MNKKSCLLPIVVLLAASTAGIFWFLNSPIPPKKQIGPPTLNKTYWALITPLGDEQDWHGRSGSKLTRSLSFYNGEYQTAFAGCHTTIGTYSTQGATINFTQKGGTVITSCNPAGKVPAGERVHLQLLQSAATYSTYTQGSTTYTERSTTLWLFDIKGKPLVVYTLMTLY